MITRWCLLLLAFPAWADEGVFDQYRDLMGDDNPAIFVIDEGEEFWYQSQGPSGATLEACDLGLGAGVTRGAYAQFPRYFADTDRVMDIETRLIHCMETLQGRDRTVTAAKPYSLRGDFGTELEALVTWLAAESEGVVIAPEQGHPKERAMYAWARRFSFIERGPMISLVRLATSNLISEYDCNSYRISPTITMRPMLMAVGPRIACHKV